MFSTNRLNRRTLSLLVFFLASVFLLLGLILSLAFPANAQTGTGTGTPGAAGTAVMGTSAPAGVSGTPGVPVTGQMARRQMSTEDLTTFSVVDRDGSQIGNVQSLVMDMRSAPVCAAPTGGSATAVPTGSAGGAAGTAVPGSVYQACKVTSGGQAAGQVAFVVVDRAGASFDTGGGAAATPVATGGAAGTPGAGGTVGTAVATESTAAAGAVGTAVATSVATGAAGGTSMTGEPLVAIPWRYIRIDPENRQLIVDASAAALANAPSYSDPNNPPDFFSSEYTNASTQFWSTNARHATGPIPATGATGTPVSTVAATPTVAATSTVAATVAATAAPSETSAVSGAGTAVATEATSVSGAVGTAVGTATSAAGGAVGTATVDHLKLATIDQRDCSGAVAPRDGRLRRSATIAAAGTTVVGTPAAAVDRRQRLPPRRPLKPRRRPARLLSAGWLVLRP